MIGGLFGVAQAAKNINERIAEGIIVGQSSGSAKADRAERTVKLLEENLSKTLLICEALWELLSQKSGLTVKDLHDKLYEIDMRDGTLDGKNQRKAVDCVNCGRKVGPRHSVCFYCGHVIDDSVFRLGL